MNTAKICIISYHTCPLSAQEGKETGGMNIYVLELAKKLSRIGYSIDIFTRVQDEKSEKIVYVLGNLRVIHLDAGPKGNIAKKELSEYIPEFVDNLREFIKDNNLSYVIFDCHYYMSGVIGEEMKKIYGGSLVITFHTLALMKNLVAKSDLEKESLERINIEKGLVKKADLIISPTETDKSYLELLYGANSSKIAVISPGVDTKLFKPIDKKLARERIGITNSDKLILFVGRIEPLKGIDVLLYSLKMLLERNPILQVCLWIVGGDTSLKTESWSDELKRLEELREILGLKSSVRFVGRKLPGELPYYYNAAEVVVAPSQYESFGMTALEAMSCGVPVITTDVTGVSDMFDQKHVALITSANNPLHLSYLMENLLVNDSFHEKISKEVFSKVQDLDWENVAKCVDSQYQQLINK